MVISKEDGENNPFLKVKMIENDSFWGWQLAQDAVGGDFVV
jgi:hypothetical protein